MLLYLKDLKYHTFTFGQIKDYETKVQKHQTKNPIKSKIKIRQTPPRDRNETSRLTRRVYCGLLILCSPILSTTLC